MSASSDFQVLFLFADTVWHFKDILFLGFLVTFNAADSLIQLLHCLFYLPINFSILQKKKKGGGGFPQTGQLSVLVKSDIFLYRPGMCWH